MVLVKGDFNVSVGCPFEATVFNYDFAEQGNHGAIVYFYHLLIELNIRVLQSIDLHYRVVVSLPIEVKFLLRLRGVLVLLNSRGSISRQLHAVGLDPNGVFSDLDISIEGLATRRRIKLVM